MKTSSLFSPPSIQSVVGQILNVTLKCVQTSYKQGFMLTLRSGIIQIPRHTNTGITVWVRVSDLELRERERDRWWLQATEINTCMPTRHTEREEWKYVSSVDLQRRQDPEQFQCDGRYTKA